MKEDAYIFAVFSWPFLITNLLSSEPLNFPYVEVMEKLLSIDLVACSIKAIASDDGRIIHRWFSTSRYVSDLFYYFIIPFRDHRSFMSEPLAQRAVTHAISSLENSLVHFLRQPPFLWSWGVTDAFGAFVGWCRGKEEGTWAIDNNSQVVKALRRLREEHPLDISDLIKRTKLFPYVRGFLGAL
jgi:hypothetical protein